MSPRRSVLVPRSRYFLWLLFAGTVACHGESDVTPTPAAQGGASACPSHEANAEPRSHDVLTQHNDAARTGATLHETELDTCTVPALSQLGEYAVDGEVYAQPLYAAAVDTALWRKNLLLIATMADSLYAFDADEPGSAPIWQLGSQGELGTPALSSRNVGGNNGILATPAIDRDSGTVYLVDRDCDPAYPATSPRCQQRLFAIELGTGKILHTLNVQGSVRDARFDPNLHWARAGLLLQAGRVFVAFGSGPNGNAHEEDFEFHGWIFSYSLNDLDSPPKAYCSTPGFAGGAIWQSGNGLAADADGLYFATGNGIHQPTPLAPAGFPTKPQAHENSLVRLPLDLSADGRGAFWDDRPYHADGNVFQYLEKNDIDLGTAGPLLIPDSNLLIAAGKSGMAYVLDRHTPSLTQAPIEAFHTPPLATGQSKYIYSYDGGPHVHGSPAFFRPTDASGAPNPGLIYFWPAHERLQSFAYDYQTGRIAPFASADVPNPESGGTLAVSADGSRADSAILWASTVDADGNSGHLWALSATTLERLWDTTLPAWAKFAVPTVAAGRVYLASTSNKPGIAPAVLVFGLSH